MLTLQALGGLVLLFVGGEALIRGAARLALRLGVAPLAVGLTVVAFGTSTPELVVTLQAALAAHGDVAVGNVVGSNICNIALILGASAVIRPIRVHAQVIRQDTPIMIVCALAAAGALANGRISRLEGGAFVACIAVYAAFNLRQARREPPEVLQEPLPAVPPPGPRGWTDALTVLAGLLALVAGGHLMVTAALGLARSFGVSEAIIGLTIVAVGTSLPELATSTIAAARGHGDIAVGNVVGSNVFNVLAILGLTAVVSPLGRGGIGWDDIGAMIAFAVVLLPMVWSGMRVTRAEGLLLLAGYAAYVGWQVATGQGDPAPLPALAP